MKKNLTVMSFALMSMVTLTACVSEEKQEEKSKEKADARADGQQMIQHHHMKEGMFGTKYGKSLKEERKMREMLCEKAMKTEEKPIASKDKGDDKHLVAQTNPQKDTTHNKEEFKGFIYQHPTKPIHFDGTKNHEHSFIVNKGNEKNRKWVAHKQCPVREWQKLSDKNKDYQNGWEKRG